MSRDADDMWEKPPPDPPDRAFRPVTITLNLAAALILLAAPAAAHTYAPIADRTLVARADLIVRGTVGSVGTVIVRGVPYEIAAIEVAEILEDGGRPGPVRRRVRVRTPGGTRPDGMSLYVPGAPRFAVGEAVILMLRRVAPGTYEVVELALGAFHVAISQGQRIAYRAVDLSPGTDIEAPSLTRGGTRWLGPRDADAFAAWIRATVAQQLAAPDYFLAAGEHRPRLPPRFALFEQDGRNFRWRDGDPFMRTRGELEGASDDGRAESRAAAASWNDASGLRIGVGDGGGGSQGFLRADGVNSIVFEDRGDEIPGSFDCDGAGTLAIGGIWFRRTTHEAGGRRFWTIVEGDVVVQDGIDCFLRRSDRGAEELLAHELGHVIGIGHSDVREALMFPFIKGDGRGGRLHDDDRAALRALEYGAPDVVLQQPLALVPVGKVEEERPDYTWTRVENATSYEFWIEESRSGDNDFRKAFSDAACGAQRCTMPPVRQANLQQDVRYKWRVRAIRNGVRGPWSVSRIFRIVAVQLERPTGLAPVGTVGELPEFTWTRVDDATSYEFWIEESRSGDNDFRKKFRATLCDAQRCTMPPPRRADLEPGTRYRWRVRAMKGSAVGRWSVDRIFRIVENG